jgi:sialate O-acetylesterase
MVKSPVAVRFAWRNTATPNLFNGADLPASCFTTEQ